MANTGLKEYNKFLDYKIGGISLKINLSNVNKNFLFISPLTLQIGKMPLDISIIYNDLCKDNIEYFGKGIRSTLYKKINEISNDEWEVENPDFTVDTFNKIEDFKYLNYENRNVIIKEYVSEDFNYKLYDKEGNVIEYNDNSNNYFKYVNIIGESKYLITYPANQIIYKNSFNDNLTLNITNNRINNCYYRDSSSTDILFETELIYDNLNRLEEIKIKKGNEYLRDESIIYGNNSYTFIDNISGNKIIITINSNSTLIEEYFLNNLIGTTTINYYINKTKVINSLGQEIIYLFSNEGLLITELEDNMAKGYVYNKTFKAPTLLTNEFRVKSIDSSVTRKSLGTFTTSNINKSEYTQTIDSDLSEIIDNLYQLEGTGNIYKTVTIEGTSNDYLTFLIWMKEMTVSSNSSAFIELMVNSDIQRIYLNDLTVCNNFRMITVGIRPKKSYSSVRMLIHLTNCTLLMGGIQLIKKGFGILYEYDELGNVIKKEDKLGISSYEYNSNNKIINVSDYVGNIKNIEYNQNNQQEINGTRYGVLEKNEYDTSNIHNLIKKTYKTIEEEFSEEYFYSNGKDLTKTKDIFSNETFYDYDTFKNISNILRLNIDVKEFNYNNKNLLSSIIRNPEDNYEVASYTYDNYYRISTITTASNSVYSFTYDNYNNICNITLDGISLINFTYDDNQMLTNLTYPNGDFYTICYSNNYKTISSISINNILAYEYTYDVELRLTGISNNDITKTYTYDNDSKIINQEINGNLIEYKYYLDELKMIIDHIDNKNFYQIYNSKEIELGANPLMLEKYVINNSNLFITTFSNPIKVNNEENFCCAKNKNNIILPILSSGGNTYNCIENVGGVNAYLPGKNSKYLSYDCNGTTPEGSGIAIGMWIKPFTINDSYIFMIRRFNLSTPAIYARLLNGSIKIYVENNQGTRINIITTDSLITNNEWTFIALNYYVDYIEEDDYGFEIYCYEFYIRNKKYTYYSQSQDYNISNLNNLRYHLGYQMINGNISNVFNGYITGLIMSNGNYLNTIFLKQYYIESFYDLINKAKTKAVDYSTHTYFHESGIYPNYDILSLRGNLESKNGLRPKIYDIPQINGEYISSSFNYNNIKNSYVYTPKSLLGYELNYRDYGTIILSFITYDTLLKETILELHDSNRKIEVYILNDYLYLNLFGTTYNLNYYVSKNAWHRLGISFSYDEPTISFRLFYDNNSTLKTKNISQLASIKTLYIGSQEENSNASNLLFGQIADVLLNEAYITYSTFNAITNTTFAISKALEYDSLGRKIKEIINYDGTEVLINTHTYDKMRIVSENLSGVGRTYNYNARNYISSIIDSTYGNHTYTYDDRGYLASDNNINYAYDGNGNILSAGSMQFIYDSNYKDRLNSVGGINITYASNNPYYPISYKNMTFTYEGRKLKEVGLPNNKKVIFYYDDEGIRYKKEIKENNVVTKTILYYYDNKRLLCEIDGNVKRNYLYDNEESIYGYVEGEMSYYYIKDSLGIIHGIKNISGQIVASYTYDAYGNIINETGTLNNNIKYKGYYYDEEIGMYYLLSRYYYPEWRRFLTPDNYTYLDFEDINDLNLFAYCNNNPIMYSDPEGHLFISAMVIGGIVGFITCAGVSAISQGITSGWNNINGWQVLFDGVIGGVSGILSSSGIGAIASRIISGCIGFAGSVGGDLISSGGDWESINWCKAASLAIANAIISWKGGAQNSKNIGEKLLNDKEVNRTFKILYDATNNYISGSISKRGFAGVFNLYGKQFINSVTDAMPAIIVKSTANGLAKNTISSIASGLANFIDYHV